MSPSPISVFHGQANAVLSCIRDRVDSARRVVVGSPELIVAAIEPFASKPLVDIIGHSNQGFLRFGDEEIVNDDRFAKIFQDLKTIGVTNVRLLGCEIGKNAGAAAAMAAFAARPGMPRIRSSERDLTCRDYNHQGLRPSSEPQVFNFVAAANPIDPPRRITQWFDANPLPPTSSTARVTHDQVLLLEQHLSTDHVCCCPTDLRDPITVLKDFEMELSSGVGRGQVCIDGVGKMFVIASAANVAVIYTVTDSPDSFRSVREIIAQW